jgi:drug/metabolite transporter (DMT)-like permease
MNYTGEIAALLTAIFWTITALATEQASIKVGSLSVNVIRLFLGFLFLTAFTFFYRGIIIPLDASPETWFWLLLSGFIGFLFGDLFLFKSYTIIGSRFSMLVMTLVPPMAAIMGRIILGEKLSVLSYLGMLLTISGISLAIFNRNKADGKLTLKLSLKGLLFAFFGAVGQALGLVLSKFGMKNYDPFAATQIRIIAGFTGFVILVTLLKRWPDVISSLKNKHAMRGISIGSFFGPFLGVSFSLIAISYTKTGIASTIMALVPILIIPPVVLIYKHKISLAEILGALISFGGVALLFIK